MRKLNAMLTPLNSLNSLILSLISLIGTGYGTNLLVADGGEGIHIEGFDQNDMFNSSSIDRFEFDDGSTRWRARAAIINSDKAANDARNEGERMVA